MQGHKTSQIAHRPFFPGGPIDLTALVRAEYLEMPGLCLTVAQAARLWNIGPDECAQALDELIRAGFLYRSRDQYVRTGCGRCFV